MVPKWTSASWIRRARRTLRKRFFSLREENGAAWRAIPRTESLSSCRGRFHLLRRSDPHRVWIFACVCLCVCDWVTVYLARLFSTSGCIYGMEYIPWYVHRQPEWIRLAGPLQLRAFSSSSCRGLSCLRHPRPSAPSPGRSVRAPYRSGTPSYAALNRLAGASNPAAPTAILGGCWRRLCPPPIRNATK